MQLRCSYCQTAFTTSRLADLMALQQMEAEGLHHYDAYCPKCRRANAVDRLRLERAYPNWRKEIAALSQRDPGA
jgi:hypothetical protein